MPHDDTLRSMGSRHRTSGDEHAASLSRSQAVSALKYLYLFSAPLVYLPRATMYWIISFCKCWIVSFPHLLSTDSAQSHGERPVSIVSYVQHDLNVQTRVMRVINTMIFRNIGNTGLVREPRMMPPGRRMLSPLGGWQTDARMNPETIK